jgi:hypothetical protein
VRIAYSLINRFRTSPFPKPTCTQTDKALIKLAYSILNAGRMLRDYQPRVVLSIDVNFRLKYLIDHGSVIFDGE